MRTSSSTIPGPKGHFLTGSLPEIRRNRLSYLRELAQTYGDTVQLKVGPAKAVFLFHPDAVQHVLQDNYSNYSKETRVFTSLKPILGNGLLVSNGDFWLRQRRLMQPAFHRQQIYSFGKLMTDETLAMITRWQDVIQPEQAIDIQNEMMQLTLAVVTQALFGNKVSDPDGIIASNVHFLLGDTIFRFDHPFYLPIWVPIGRNQQFKEARQSLDRIIYDLIARRRGHESEFHDLLSMLMQGHYEGNGSGMTNKQLRDEVMTLFLAGHETTAVALSWTLYLLSQHPNIEARLSSELEATLGGKTPTLEDLPGLTYTRMVLDESMRIYPPAWITERMTLTDDEICGHSVSAGTTVVVSPYITHRHPAFWTEPEEFSPERFNPQQSNSRPRYAYFPFGGGPRQCIGNNFALVEAQLILAMLIQRYHFELMPGWKVEAEPLITLRPKNGLWMKVNRK